MPALVTEHITIASDTPGIQLYIRNKRPQELDGFGRPDFALRARRDLSRHDRVRPPARRHVVDGLHRRARLGRLSGGPARLRPVDASGGNGPAGEGQQADRHHRCRRARRQRRGGFHPQASRRVETQSARLVLGHFDHGDLHRRQQRQGQQTRAVCPALAAQHARPDRRRRAAGRVSRGNEGKREEALARRAFRRTNRRTSSRRAGSTPGRKPHGQPIRRQRTADSCARPMA